MEEKVETVRWMIATHPHVCCECQAEIWAGMKFAHYVEVLAVLATGKRPRFPHDYCEECGHLLEDSLTTTEAVS